jgi:LysM repeat protein
MEFWLVDINYRQKLRLPVPPAEFKNEGSQNINIVDINDFGEYSQKGKKQLDRMTIKSFFPAQYYSFCQYKNFPKPYKFVGILELWKENKHPFRLLITGTSINKLFYIESFTYGERAGSRDVDFELSLVEYRPLVEKKTSSNSPKNTRPSAQPNKPKTYKVVAGDTLSAIARKFYGDPNKWKDIAKKNGIKDQSKLQVGKVLILP